MNKIVQILNNFRPCTKIVHELFSIIFKTLYKSITYMTKKVKKVLDIVLIISYNGTYDKVKTH